MTGIQFVTDQKGRTVAVQIDLRTQRALWEDFYDGLVSEQRRKEKGVPFETVAADVITRGRLRGSIRSRYHAVRAVTRISGVSASAITVSWTLSMMTTRW